MSCLALFRTLIFWSKNQSFLSKISKNDPTCFLPKKEWKKSLMFGQKLWISPFGKCRCFALLKREKIFSNIIGSKTLMRKSLNFGQKPWTNFVGKGRLLALFTTLPFWSKIILFYLKHQKINFSDLIIPKNPNEKKFDVSTQTMDYLLRKMTIFWQFFKYWFSGLKIILFYPEYQKTIFSDFISQNKRNKKNFDFWTKTMD